MQISIRRKELQTTAGKEKYMKKQEAWGREIVNTQSKEYSNHFIFSEIENKEKA